MHTLNPEQIIEAIKSRNISKVYVRDSAIISENKNKEGIIYFKIGDQEYQAYNGHIEVHYSFDLDEKFVLLLKQKAIEEDIKRCQEHLNSQELELTELKNKLKGF